MSSKDVSEWAKKHPKIALAAVNLRISGVSERVIFERYRDLLAEPPSYRELRAAFREHGVSDRAHATELRRSRTYYDRKGEVYTAEKVKGGTSRYLSRRNDRIANPTPRMRRKLADNTVLGRTLAFEDDEKAYKDKEVIDFLTSEFEGYPV